MNIAKLQQQVIEWNLQHGIQTSIEQQQYFTQCEAQEYHSAKGEAKLFELGDWFFTAGYLYYLVSKADKEYHTSLQECINLIREHDALKYAKAVIDSNWTKYVQAKDTSILKMSEEAEAIAEKYRGRYSRVVPRRVGDYYFIVGLENNHEKVLKPSSFIPAKDLI